MSMKALPILFIPFSLPSIYIFARTWKKKYFASIFNKHYAFELLITGAGLIIKLKSNTFTLAVSLPFMTTLFVILASESEVDGHVLFSFYIVFRLWHFVHGLMHVISSTFRSDNFHYLYCKFLSHKNFTTVYYCHPVLIILFNILDLL